MNAPVLALSAFAILPLRPAPVFGGARDAFDPRKTFR